MKRRPLLALVVMFGAAALLPAADDTMTEPGPLLVVGENDAAWREFFTTLAGKGAIRSQFREERWFQFRKEPVVVSGEMRLDPTLGLSLHYAEQGGRTMIVDDEGMLLRDARGRSRAGAPDPRAPNIGEVLRPLLRFDFAELNQDFALHAARSGDAWRLDFVPRQRELERTLGRITVRGSGEAVQSIQLERGARQRIRIAIGETETGVTFSAEDRERFFR